MGKLIKRGTTNFPEGSEDHSVRCGTPGSKQTDQLLNVAQPVVTACYHMGHTIFVLSLLPGLWASAPCRRPGGSSYSDTASLVLCSD